jgi:branched-chain amino acid aminotransferase
METLVYINGQLVPESEAKVSIFDIGFMYSAVFYESVRTFKRKIYMLEEHLDRLEGTMRSVGLPLLLPRAEVARAMEMTLEANIPRFPLAPDNDCWLCAEVTPGMGFPHPRMKGKKGDPTLIVYASLLPFDEYARCYAEGKPARVATVLNVPPSVVDPRGKSRFRLHYFRAKLETSAIDPEAFALLMGTDGFLTEGTGANVFTVRKGVLHTPTTRNILEGISRAVVIRLARELAIPVVESDMTLFDLYNAEEAFWTTSSYCILPMSRVNHVPVGKELPGPITARLLEAWSSSVGVDIVAQARKYAHIASNVWRGAPPRG